MDKIAAFSLPELLVTLTIVAILLAIGLPTSHYLIAENHTSIQVNRLLSALNYTRSEAIKYDSITTFCKSLDHKSCSGNWQDGQIVKNTAGTILRVFPPVPTGDKLIWNSSSGKDDYLQFAPTGFTNGQRGSFYYCHGKDVSYGRVIVINDSGRAYVKNMLQQDFLRYCL